MNLNKRMSAVQKHGLLESFWTMMMELASHADNDNDSVLKHQVEGYFRQWNTLTDDDKVPAWVARVAADPQADLTALRRRVRYIVLSQLGKPDIETFMCDDTPIVLLGADSLDGLEVLMALEDDFEIEIFDEDAEKLSTINQVTAYLAKRGFK